MSNLLFQPADHTLGNFMMINKEIFLLKDEKGKGALSLEAIGLFTRLLTLQGIDWDFTIAGLAKICGCTHGKVENALNELKEKGYFVKLDSNRTENGCFSKHCYKVFETANEKWWLKNFTHADLPHVEFPHVDKPHVDKQRQYNIESNIKHNLIENIIEYNIPETSFGETEKTNFSNIYNINNVIDYSSIHDNMNSFSNHELHDSIDKVTEKSKDSDKYIQKKSNRTIKGYSKDGNPVKNQEQLNSEKEKQPVEKVLGKKGKPFSKQTNEEIVENNLNRIGNVANEKIREIQAKDAFSRNSKSKRKNLIFGFIENEEPQELQKTLKNFFGYCIDEGTKLQEVNYRTLMQELEKLSDGDIEKKKKIINQSISHTWRCFYALEEDRNHANKKAVEQTKPITNPADMNNTNKFNSLNDWLASKGG